MKILSWLMLATGACVTGGLAHAQEKPEYLLKKDETNKRPADAPCAVPAEKKPEEPPPDWTFKARVGTVFQLSQSTGVVGKLDGSTRSIQGDAHLEANWKHGDHELRNRFDANDLLVKTQNTGRWLPASDFVEIESIYQHHTTEHLGPFVRAGLRTSLFLGRDLRTNAVKYQLPNGELTDERTEYRLTDRFLPLTLLQSVGVFYNPVKRKHFDIDVRGGIGVREVFANRQLGLLDKAETPDIVELTQLRSYQEAGLESIIMVRGELWDEKVSYYFGGEFLIPILRSSNMGDNRGPVELISKTIRICASYRLAKSATLLYELRLVQQPQLVDTVQILNNVGFKATFNLL
jgi:hypothetical protein